MITTKSISVVIPILNGEKFIENQWRSFVLSGLLECISDIIYVNDGSSDGTLSLLSRIQSESSIPVKIINNPETRGRFLARLTGARSSTSSHILFLDSRLTIEKDFAHAFAILKDEADCLMGHVDIDISRNVFCLYWDRTHRVIFKSHFEQTKTRVVMTKDNVTSFLKGTTVFYTSRPVFIDVCSRYESKQLLNDDTVVIEEIAAVTPLVLDPSWRISWVPRETFRAFLGRMWERGPSFAEYHVFTRRGGFFWIVLIGLAALVFWIGLAIANPSLAIAVALTGVMAIISTTVFFSKSLKEFLLMAPLHFATLVTFGCGIIFGIGINLRKKIFMSSN